MIRKNYLLNWMKKPKKAMKYLMQIKVERFEVAYEVKVKNIIEMRSGCKNWRKKITIRSTSTWLLLRKWILSKVGKALVGKLQEEIQFRAFRLRNWQACMNEMLFNWIRFWMELNNCLIGWIMDEQFCPKKFELKTK